MEGNVYQLGLPPRRIDILTRIDGVDFQEAWDGRIGVRVEGMDLPFLGKAQLIRTKTATGRAKDRADLALLAETERGEGSKPGPEFEPSSPVLPTSKPGRPAGTMFAAGLDGWSGWVDAYRTFWIDPRGQSLDGRCKTQFSPPYRGTT